MLHPSRGSRPRRAWGGPFHGRQVQPKEVLQRAACRVTNPNWISPGPGRHPVPKRHRRVFLQRVRAHRPARAAPQRFWSPATPSCARAALQARARAFARAHDPNARHSMDPGDWQKDNTRSGSSPAEATIGYIQLTRPRQGARKLLIGLCEGALIPWRFGQWA